MSGKKAVPNESSEKGHSVGDLSRSESGLVHPVVGVGSSEQLVGALPRIGDRVVIAAANGVSLYVASCRSGSDKYRVGLFVQGTNAQLEQKFRTEWEIAPFVVGIRCAWFGGTVEENRSAFFSQWGMVQGELARV